VGQFVGGGRAGLKSGFYDIEADRVIG